MEHELLGCSRVLFPIREHRNTRKGIPIFPDVMFQTEIRVPFSGLGGRYLEKELHDFYKW